MDKFDIFNFFVIKIRETKNINEITKKFKNFAKRTMFKNKFKLFQYFCDIDDFGPLFSFLTCHFFTRLLNNDS